jgi:hypothetical protein
MPSPRAWTDAVLVARSEHLEGKLDEPRVVLDPFLRDALPGDDLR